MIKEKFTDFSANRSRVIALTELSISAGEHLTRHINVEEYRLSDGLQEVDILVLFA